MMNQNKIQLLNWTAGQLGRAGAFIPHPFFKYSKVYIWYYVHFRLNLWENAVFIIMAIKGTVIICQPGEEGGGGVEEFS